MKVDKLPVATGAEVTARHEDIEHDELLPALLDVLVVGDRDGQRPLLRVVHVLDTSALWRLQSVNFTCR